MVTRAVSVKLVGTPGYKFRVSIILTRNLEATQQVRAPAGPWALGSQRLGWAAVAKRDEPRKMTRARSGSAEAKSATSDFVSRYETAEYIASMLKTLQQLALQQGLTFLSYLIGLALKEATIEKVKQR